MSIVVAAVSSRQKDQGKRKHDHLLSCTYRVEFWGGGCRHWSEEIEKESTDAEGQRDKQGWRRWWRWNRGMQSYRKFGLWQEASEDIWVLEWCEHVDGHGLQDGLHSSLKFADQGLRETSREKVAIDNAWEHERNYKSFCGIISEVVANSANMLDFQESSFADEVAVFFHRKILV